MNDKPRNFSQAIEDLENTVAKLRPHLEDISSRVGDETKKAKSKVETEIQKNPWAAIGIVGLVLFVVGFLLGFKSSRSDD